MYTPKEPNIRYEPDRLTASPQREHGVSLREFLSTETLAGTSSPASDQAAFSNAQTRAGDMGYAPDRLKASHHGLRGGSTREFLATETVAATGRSAPQQTTFSDAQKGAGIMGYVRTLRTIGPDDIVLWLRDGWVLISAITILFVAIALIYAVTAQPRYTVYTDIVIDPSNLQVVSDDVFGSSPLRDSQLLEVESKLRILTSRNVLTRVIDDLNLTQDREFVKPDILAGLKSLFGASDDATESDKVLTAMRALSERVEARREERSFVVALGVYTDDPQKSVMVSDAIVAAFENEIFESAAKSAGRVASTLNQRLEDLRQNVTEAEARVEEFKRLKGLQSSNGELVSTQLASELNTQVLAAQQRSIEMETRYQQMQAAIAAGRTETASIFASPAMSTLRQEYDTAIKQLNALTLTYGTRHPRITAANSELETLRVSIVNEAKRIAETAQGDMQQAKSTLEALQSKAGEQQSNVYTDYDSQVVLRDLERDSRTKAALYESHLTRAQQIAEQQQINTSNISVISRAMPPKSRSWPPRTLILLGAGAVSGLMFGIAMAILRGGLRTLRFGRQHMA